MDNSLRILMLNYEFPPIGGGAANAHLHLLKEYAGNGKLRVDVLTSGPEPGFSKEALSDNVTIYKVGIHKKDLHYWRKIEVIEWLVKSGFHYRRLLRENSYDIVHAFFGFPTGWLCYRTAHKLPYIISLRGSDVPGYNERLGIDYKLLAGLFRKIWNRASAVVANSDGLRNLASQFMPELDIEVIPNGIDCDKFFLRENKEFGKPIRLLTVCRLISRKRIDILIEAVSLLNKAGVDVELNVAGEGNLMNPLKELTADLGIAAKVNFMGRVVAEHIPEVYQQNDLFVMSSAHEGMSNAMLEAMASGLPIVTTRCEGLDELIVDNGIIVEQDSSEAIAEGIKKVISDRDIWRQMCVAARNQAQKFTWNGVAEAYLGLYQKVLDGLGEHPLN
ncbi:MAG: glycosyltransferase family 4 protein [Planctomycetota bacterium]